MTAITLDTTAFRAEFPSYADATLYPDALLQATFTTATAYVSNNGNAGYSGGYYCSAYFGLSLAQQTQALYLMTAHLLFIAGLAAQNGGTGVPGLTQSATIDKVSVSLTPPPVKSNFQWWLALSPYGQALLVLLGIAAVGGFSFGGSPELSAFRRVGGGFSPFGRFGCGRW